MYYKIENKESKYYKALYELRKNEKQIESDNLALLKEKIGLEWDGLFGVSGQQHFSRVTQYMGFKFKDADKVDPKVWVRDGKYNFVFVPNLKTKAGRDMRDFLNNMKGSCYINVHEAIGHKECLSRFTFPFLEIGKDDVVYLFIDEQIEPESPDFIEVTKSDFIAALKSEKQ